MAFCHRCTTGLHPFSSHCAKCKGWAKTVGNPYTSSRRARLGATLRLDDGQWIRFPLARLSAARRPLPCWLLRVVSAIAGGDMGTVVCKTSQKAYEAEEERKNLKSPTQSDKSHAWRSPEA